MAGSCSEGSSTRSSTNNFNTEGPENGDHENGEVQANEDVFYENNDKPKRKRQRALKLWKDKWQELYPWASLKKVNGEERIFCSFCEAYGCTTTRNAFRMDGSCNFQPSALFTHENSSAHRNACLSQIDWAQTGIGDTNRKNGTENKAQDMASHVFESTVIAEQLACMANMLETAVTREEFYTLRAELHIMQRSEDARRINSFCAPTDPLVPITNLDGTIPDNFPGSVAEMMLLPSNHIEALLMEYKLPIHGTHEAKLKRLKAHLGFYC